MVKLSSRDDEHFKNGLAPTALLYCSCNLTLIGMFISYLLSSLLRLRFLSNIKKKYHLMFDQKKNSSPCT